MWLDPLMCVCLISGTNATIWNTAGSHANSRSTLEVPIFWFIHGEPLLVDKHYQAKALSDMIIVVQSEDSSLEGHLHCNGHSLLWNLRLVFRHVFLLFLSNKTSLKNTKGATQVHRIGTPTKMEKKIQEKHWSSSPLKFIEAIQMIFGSCFKNSFLSYISLSHAPSLLMASSSISWQK